MQTRLTTVLPIVRELSLGATIAITVLIVLSAVGAGLCRVQSSVYVAGGKERGAEEAGAWVPNSPDRRCAGRTRQPCRPAWFGAGLPAPDRLGPVDIEDFLG